MSPSSLPLRQFRLKQLQVHTHFFLKFRILGFGYSGLGTMSGAYGQTFNNTGMGNAQQFSRYGTMANKANPTNLGSAMR
jgi:hypothetical protein